MIFLSNLLRATADFVDRVGPSPRPPAICHPPASTPLADTLNDAPFTKSVGARELKASGTPHERSNDFFGDLAKDDQEPAWKRFYEEDGDDGDMVPDIIVRACIEDLREATVLHAVAVLEIIRKWGLGRDS